MEENEEKGFVVKDRRKISLDDGCCKSRQRSPVQETTEAEPEEERAGSSGGTSGGA